jgi:predicted choloylglycine hydrolase
MNTKTNILVALFITSMMSACCPCNRSSIRFSPPTSKSFPLLEISGSHQEIGYAIGSVFKREIQMVFSKRSNWFQRIKKFADQHPDNPDRLYRIQAETHYPELMEELQGMSSGAEVSFRDLFLLNIHAELTTLMNTCSKAESTGCSTIYWLSDRKKLLFHNEDGHLAYQSLMFMIKATLPSGTTILTLTYPGFLMGNGPAVNSHGIFQTTNFISAGECRIGIPRYVLGRAVLESKSLEEAIRIVTRPERGYPYHHNLGSLRTGKMYSVEVTPDDFQVIEPGHLYVHTNHLVLDRIRSFPQDREYVNSSSMSRYSVISETLNAIDHSRNIKIGDIHHILSSHKRAPYSPCRHPGGPVQGATLATAVIDVIKGTMCVYRGKPCYSIRNQNLTVYSLGKPGD